MTDWTPVLTAIAARYPLATPPAGLPAIRVATADLPNTITALPALLLFPDSGTLQVGNGTRLGGADLIARFYLGAPKSLTRDMVKLRKWLGILTDVHLTAMQLGGLVVAVRTTRWKVGMMTYGSIDYSGIELGLHVVTSEPWAPTA